MRKLIIVLGIFIQTFILAQSHEILLNLEPGQTYSFQTQMRMKMKQKMYETDIPVNLDVDFGISMKVISSNADSYRLECVYDAFVMKMEMMGMLTEMSSHGDPKNYTNKMYKNMIQLPFWVEIQKNGVTTKVEGAEKLGEKMIEAFPAHLKDAVAKDLIEAFNEENITNSINQLFFAIPKKPVVVGESWKSIFRQESNRMKYVYEMIPKLTAVHDDHYEIDFTGDVKTTGDEDIEIQKMKMKGFLNGTSQGKVLINRKTGWIEKSDNYAQIKGHMLVMEPTEMKIDMEMSMDYFSKNGKINVQPFKKNSSKNSKISNNTTKRKK